jgi:hypothetical protein
MVPANPGAGGQVEGGVDEFRLVLEPGEAEIGAGWWWFTQEWIPEPEEIRERGSGLLIANPDYPGGSWFTLAAGFNTHHAISYESGDEYMQDVAAERRADITEGTEA